MERARERSRDRPGGGPQGVQGRRGREARLHAPRAAGDAIAAEARGEPLARTAPAHADASSADIARAAELIRGAERPIALAGNGAVRGWAAREVRAFARRSGIPVATTFMAKGLLEPDDPLALDAVGLHSGDDRLTGFDEADLVVAIGYDLVEHAPRHWNPAKDKKIVCIDPVSAEIDEHFVPEGGARRRNLGQPATG